MNMCSFGLMQLLTTETYTMVCKNAWRPLTLTLHISQSSGLATSLGAWGRAQTLVRSTALQPHLANACCAFSSSPLREEKKKGPKEAKLERNWNGGPVFLPIICSLPNLSLVHPLLKS